MDFVGIVIFAIFLYVRPQEMFGFLEALRPAFLSLAITGLGLFIRPGGVNLKQIIRTPQDWMMAAYFIYILFWTPGSFGDLWSELYPYIGFYFLVVLALTNFERIYQYLWWWCGCVLFIAVLALLSLIGIDPLGSAGTTAGSLGRLTLNLSLFSNPNALGHSVIVAVPLLYFLTFWKRPIFIKEVGGFLMIFPLLCALFTQSKGAFMSGFAAILATFTFGKPKWIQVLIVAGAFTFGLGGLQLLPRFDEVQIGGGGGRRDEAISGRLDAFEFGKWAFEHYEYGVGFKRFYPEFIRKEGELKARASHSSFNQVQAEFGFWGLLIFSGILYTCFHSLGRAKTADDNEERVRRMLLCMLMTYFVSSWLIDFGFRAAFFVMVAMVSAFHRILMDRQPGFVSSESPEPAAPDRFTGLAPALAGAGAMDGTQIYLAERKVVRGVPTRPRQALSAQTGVAVQSGLSGRSRAESEGYVAPIKDLENLPNIPTPYMPWPKFRWYDAIGIYLSYQIVIAIRNWVIVNI
jgi:hypothetical protein